MIHFGTTLKIIWNCHSSQVPCTSHTHCTIDPDTQTFEICKANQCVPVDCTSRKHCPAKNVCNKKRECEEVECTSHDHCVGNNNGRSKCNGQDSTEISFDAFIEKKFIALNNQKKYC